LFFRLLKPAARWLHPKLKQELQDLFDEWDSPLPPSNMPFPEQPQLSAGRDYDIVLPADAVHVLE